MKRSKNLLGWAVCAVVLTTACNSKSDSKSGSGSKPSRKHTAVAGAHSGSSGHKTDSLDASVADGGDGAAPEADGGSDAGPSDAAISSSDAAQTEAGAQSGGAAGMSAVNGDPGAVDRGPYYAGESWKGYLWISEHGQGSMIAPTTDFAAPTFESKVCIKGSVVPTPDSSGNAMLGMNINQAHRTDAPTLTVVPSHDGVRVDVVNTGGSPLRIQVHAPDGATNGMSRWCAMINGSGGFIPWSRFNTACWDGSGNAYDREPISSAMLLVPGNTESAVSYDFCLLRLAEADAPLITQPTTNDDAGAAESGGDPATN